MFSVLVVLHILAAVAWIGGMIFLSLVLAPLVVSRKAAPEFMALFRLAALRFRIVVWTAIGILLTTGPMLLAQRSIDMMNPATWPGILTLKLGLVAVLLLLTFSHDLVLGPKVSQTRAIPASSHRLLCRRPAGYLASPCSSRWQLWLRHRCWHGRSRCKKGHRKSPVAISSIHSVIPQTGQTTPPSYFWMDEFSL
ncbi:MAG: hypothetical protein HP477_07615 [Nitrospira sp.]|nr:hypothetical protein [Nitrospira sp.]